MIIERMYLRHDGAWTYGKWNEYSYHRWWSMERAQKSVDRLNEVSPGSWLYRVRAKKVVSA